MQTLVELSVVHSAVQIQIPKSLWDETVYCFYTVWRFGWLWETVLTNFMKLWKLFSRFCFNIPEWYEVSMVKPTTCKIQDCGGRFLHSVSDKPLFSLHFSYSHDCRPPPVSFYNYTTRSLILPMQTIQRKFQKSIAWKYIEQSLKTWIINYITDNILLINEHTRCF